MSNFGFNLLSCTQSVIGQQDYQLIQWLGTTTDDRGYEIDAFSDPIPRKAGIYPLSRESIKKQGLSFEKSYIQIFDTELIKLLSRSRNADKIIFSGYVWRAMPSDNDWMESGGWNQVTAAREEKYNA